MSRRLSPHETAAAIEGIQRRGLRSGCATGRLDPIDADDIAERVLAAKSAGIYHEPPEPPGPAAFPAQKPKTPKTSR